MEPDDCYTVIGVWVDDEAVPVGVVAGQHTVTGGRFSLGLWATSTRATSPEEAERLAVAEMADSLPRWNPHDPSSMTRVEGAGGQEGEYDAGQRR